MKTLHITRAVALATLVLVSGCSGEDVEAKMSSVTEAASGSLDKLGDELGSLDFSALDPEALKAKAGEVTESLSAKLGEIKDEASAVDVTKAAEPLVEGLSKMKGLLGDKMPDLGSLTGIVDELKQKFGDNESIMKVLQPLLDKLTGLLK